MSTFLILVFARLSLAFWPFTHGCTPGKISRYTNHFTSMRSGYYPHDSRMEGGFVDRQGHPLQTLQDYLAGNAGYVSVAMDVYDPSLPYGTIVRIPEVERWFKRCIEFHIVDTGDRFAGEHTRKIDICNDTKENTLGDWSNGSAEVFVVDRVE